MLRIVRRLVAAAVVLVTAAIPVAAQQTGGTKSGPVVLLAAIEGPIGPATVNHVDRVIGLAEDRHAAALVLRLNTPGGLADAMREIISHILASRVPVIGYVAPSGAHAASAGTYILYATHVAAMAPGTNLGAATPVSIGGPPQGLPGGGGKEGQGDKPGNKTPGGENSGKQSGASPPGDTMKAKATNDAVALIRSLAEMHGRNADWAERAVREAASLSARQALEMNVIDLVAKDVDGLLAAVDGRTVEVAGAKRKLATAGLPVETVEMGAVTRLLSVLSNPNVALVLMMIGVYGLILEFWNPGAVAPGVIGAISLTLGFYALNQLPLDYAGLTLIGLGIAFMAFEAVTPTFGVLGLGGLIAFVLGSSMLIDTDVPAYQVSWWTIGIMAAVSAAVLILVLGLTVRAYRRAPAGGYVTMTGVSGSVLEWSGAQGFVWAEGDRWSARGPAGLKRGQTVQVREIDGLTLIVEAVSDERPEAKG